MVNQVFLAALVAMAVSRATRLITLDAIMQPGRSWVLRKTGQGSLFNYLVNCWACVSIWMGLLAAIGLCVSGAFPWWTLPLLALAFSQFTVFTEEVMDRLSRGGP